MKRIFILVLIGLFTFSAKAQDNLSLDGWKVNGTSQIIPYFDGRDFNNDTYAPGHTSMKTILGVTKSFGEKVDFRVAVQDWRVFGNNKSVTYDENALHLMEGWVRFNDIFGMPVSLKAGRFQMSYGSERFIGKSFWNYQERKFDGFVFNYTGDNMFIDFFLTNHSSEITSQTFSKIPNTSYIEPYSNYNIYGLWYNNTAFDGQTFDIFAYLDENAATVGGEPALNRYTIGFDYYGKFGIIKPNVEFGYQLGKAGDKDILAYLASVSADVDLDPLGVKFGLDMHSGSEDGNAEEINTYDNYLAGKHKFFGLMDYFVTARGSGYAGIGVNDIYGGVSYKSGKYKYSLMAHYFMANAENENIIYDGEEAGTAFGTEFDLILRYTINKGIFVEAGQGLFLPGDLMKAVYNGNEDMAFLSYLRAVVKL